MQELIGIWLLSMLALALAGLAVSIVWDMVREYLANRAKEKRIEANRNDIFRDIDTEGVMGYSDDLPAPCRICKVMRNHGCQMQPICTEVKAYYRRVTEYELTAQAVERAYRIRKQRSRKYKGGAM